MNFKKFHLSIYCLLLAITICNSQDRKKHYFNIVSKNPHLLIGYSVSLYLSP